MAEKDKFIIKVEGKLVEVTPEVYYAYFRMERQERGQEEKKQQHDVFSYDALDNCETVGMEAIVGQFFQHRHNTDDHTGNDENTQIAGAHDR